MYSKFDYDKNLIKCCPSPRQLAIQQMEFYAFIHFSVNTFTDSEWGDGTEDEILFNPTEFNANQWVDVLKKAGIKGLILTCKHHDGFCLWPSAYTEHSVKNSPFRNGKGDVVREVSDACAKAGIKFGIYLSPWDRNHADYGKGKPYDDYFCNQLNELLTNYGDIFAVWFDGACGEGPNGKQQIYNWNRYYELIREKQPMACISICGPDVRWCGNEAGDMRESEWSVLPTEFMTPDEVAANSQHEDTTCFREKKINYKLRDLGSREYLFGAKNYRWYPSETDTSIRPGWFYHKSEDNLVSSPDTLIDLWYRTVGGNSMLLLNIPPDRRGLLHENDVHNLEILGDYIRKTFAVNLATNAKIISDKDDGFHTCEALKADNYDNYYKTVDGDNTAVITITFDKLSDVSHVVLKEHIPMSQRVEAYIIEAKSSEGSWVQLSNGTTIGYKKIEKFEPIKTEAIRVSITDSRVSPVLSFIGIY